MSNSLIRRSDLMVHKITDEDMLLTKKILKRLQKRAFHQLQVLNDPYEDTIKYRQ